MEILNKLNWLINKPPSTAELRIKRKTIPITEDMLNTPVDVPNLYLPYGWDNGFLLVEFSNRTIGGVLQSIYDFYQQEVEDTTGETEKLISFMGDHKFWEGCQPGRNVFIGS